MFEATDVKGLNATIFAATLCGVKITFPLGKRTGDIKTPEGILAPKGTIEEKRPVAGL
jgi:hypothetical protein